MARRSKAVGKRGAAKTRKASPVKGRNPKTRSQEAQSSSKKAPRTKLSIADLKKQIGRQARELEEARRQQAASSKVLHIIGASGSLIPIFQAIVKNAVELCGARFGAVFKMEGNLLHLAAHNFRATQRRLLEAQYPMTPNQGHVSGRAILTRSVVQIPDVSIDEDYRGAKAKQSGFRSLLATPLLRGGRAIGSIVIYKAEAGAFTARQRVLLQSFAAQAVIAIENARLFNETKEALERQRATTEVLTAISGSMSDAKPVFEVIVQSCERLFESSSVGLMTVRDGQLDVGAYGGQRSELIQAMYPAPLSRRSASGVAILDRRTLVLEDIDAPGVPPMARDGCRALGMGSAIFAPLLADGRSIGSLFVGRPSKGAFAPGRISLVEAFASQAVIAIENARLFNEVKAKTRDLTESLQQQTATADVLKVISRSAFDLGSVMNTLTHSAAELCKAEIGALYLREGDVLVARGVADADSAQADFLRRTPLQNDSSTYVGRAILAGTIRNIADVTNETEIGLVKRFSEALGFRSILFVPLMREGRGIGVFALARKRTGQFSQREVDLVQTFADQAVIAIENVRLFDEVQARTRELAKSLDDLRAAQDRLVQTEKLASLGQLTAGIAHEIKNPLNFVNNFSALSAELVAEMSDVLARTSVDAATRDELEDLGQMLKSNLEKVVQHGKRADSIVKNMLQHSREGSREHRPVDINTIVNESLNLAYHGARAEKPGFDIALQRDLDPSAGLADVYPQEITRVLLNIISNGFYAAAKRKAEAGECFEPMLVAVTRNIGDKIEIRIRDNGSGIPDAIKEKIFNPFFTTKPAGEGTGLGLSMSHDIIVKQHSGSIDVDTEAGVFTEFKILLPRTSQS